MLSRKQNRLYERYGTRRGFIRTLWHRLLFVFGRYRKYRQVDWRQVDRLIFVCKGNICRSPFAEAVARSAGLAAISCGLDTVEGVGANPGALEAATRTGQDLSVHRTRTVTSITTGKGDLFVAMEPRQAETLEQFFGKDIDCTLLGVWCKPGYPYIQDPYGNKPACFDRSFSLIRQSVCEITREIQKAKNN